MGENPRSPADADAPRLDVAFTPGDAADRIVIGVIEGARREVLVQAYSFTHSGIAQALIAARRRGVAVRVIADRGQTERISGWLLERLVRGGVEVRLDALHEAAHNKVMVIDATTRDAAVITGSYNFSIAAQNRNAENLLVIRGAPELVRKYQANWELHLRHSAPWGTGP